MAEGLMETPAHKSMCAYPAKSLPRDKVGAVPDLPPIHAFQTNPFMWVEPAECTSMSRFAPNQFPTGRGDVIAVYLTGVRK